MGFSGISVWQLLIVLLIVIMIFGTRRLKTLGEDLGGAVGSFRQATAAAQESVQEARIGRNE